MEIANVNVIANVNHSLHAPDCQPHTQGYNSQKDLEQLTWNLSQANLQKRSYKNFLKRVLSKVWRNLQENTQPKTQPQVIGCNLAKMSAGTTRKNCVRKLRSRRPGRHMQAFYMSIKRLLSPGMTLGIRNLKTLSNLAFKVCQGFHKFYFILYLLEPGEKTSI